MGPVFFKSRVVRRVLKGLKIKKSSGPECLSPTVFENCRLFKEICFVNKFKKPRFLYLTWRMLNELLIKVNRVNPLYNEKPLYNKQKYFLTHQNSN